jgi:hypothetical protein
MPTLTIEIIRENPWNVLTHELPGEAAEVLLETALLAARYCRSSEYMLAIAAREGRYRPRAWRPLDGYPDAHEENEGRGSEDKQKLDDICARGFWAEQKLDEICGLGAKEHGWTIRQ